MGCISSAGESVDDLWNSLIKQKDNSADVDLSSWPSKAKEFWADKEETPRACKFIPNTESVKTELVNNLVKSFDQMKIETPLKKLGIILASTKGIIEDFIWNEEKYRFFNNQNIDPLSPILESFINNISCRSLEENESELKHEIVKSICISNACASSHAAVYLANTWLKNNTCENVLILACDYIGPFIMTGFKTLKALTTSKVKPFDKNRDGLQLGEACGSLLLSTRPSVGKIQYKITSVDIENESFAVTRPSEEGRGLYNVVKNVIEKKKNKPNVIIAHGTATPTNDQIEYNVYSTLFNNSTVITATKWSVGHCLGASGLIDMIAACKILSTSKVFPIGNTAELEHENICPEKKMAPSILLNETIENMDINSVLISSLGFGGTHGALVLDKEIQN